MTRARAVAIALASLALARCGDDRPVRATGRAPAPRADRELDLTPVPLRLPSTTGPRAPLPDPAPPPSDPGPTSTPAPPSVPEPRTPAPRAPATPSGGYRVVAVEKGGSIRGRCRISATVAPWDVKVDKDVDKGCKGDHKTERMVVGEGGALAHCLVYLAQVEGGKDWPEGMREEDRSVLIDQKTCMYVPHVQWVRAETQLAIQNSDQADHNIHGYLGSLSATKFNIFSPPGVLLTDSGSAFLDKPGTYIVKCDIHPWMSAYVHAVVHPYHAVTSAQAAPGLAPGEYVLDQVPPGEYQIVCWHEGMDERPQVVDGKIATYSYGADFTEVRRVEVRAGEETRLDDFVVPAPKR